MHDFQVRLKERDGRNEQQRSAEGKNDFLTLNKIICSLFIMEIVFQRC